MTNVLKNILPTADNFNMKAIFVKKIKSLVMQHYQWYAMVNHCLALVVIIHKTAERNEMRTHKTREREREKER